MLFYLAFLPQVTDPHRSSLAVQLLLLGLVFVVLGLLVDSTIALLSGRIGTMLRTRPKASRRLNEVAGIVFIGLAARLTI